MQTLYVYYKLPTDQHALWRPRVENFAQRLRQRWPGLQVELMQRPDPSAEGQETWMEVYRHPDGVSAPVIAAIGQLAIELGLPPKRAAEIFIPLR
jgi:hypothetical protein